MTVRTHPEPLCDIHAQLAYMDDPLSGKPAVFVSIGNEDVLPQDRTVYARADGYLMTRASSLGHRFVEGERWSDAEMAAALDYPTAKLAALSMGEPRMIQIRDRNDHVAKEFLASRRDPHFEIYLADAYVPAAGKVIVLFPEMALARRAILRGAHG